jgi:hypothetical protein
MGESAGSIKVRVPWALDDPISKPSTHVWGALDSVNRQYVKALVENVSGAVFIGPNPPPNPVDGMLWWRTEDSDLYIYITDATSSQWVAATATPGSPAITPFIPADFPPNPTVGDMYISNGTEYQWDGIVWTRISTGVTGDALVPIAPTPPANPQPGQLWWRNDPDGVLYIFYFDGATSQWVPATPASSGTSNALVPIGQNPPANPQAGQLWWRNDPDATLYIFYFDGTTSQWVTATPAGGGGVTQAYVDQQDALRVLKSGDTITGPLTLADVTGSTYLELVGSAQNNIAFRGSGPASGAPQWAIDVITGQAPAMNGFHLARLSPDGFTVIDDVFNILNSDGIIRAGTIRTKSGDPVDTNDLARKAYIDQRVLKTGDTMTGPLVLIDPVAISIDLNGIVGGIQFKNPNNAPQWIIDVDAGTGQNIAGFYIQRVSPDGNTVLDIPIQIYNSDGIIRSNMIRTTAGDPVDPNDLARKAYVDSLLAPLLDRIAQLEAQLQGRSS